jgi:uncharacterized protein YndB with AHSA1/START domain
MSTMTTDRIEKQTMLQAPRSRVWRALADSKEFGTWFKVDFSQPFKAGVTQTGRITHPGYEHLLFDFMIEKIEPERYFSYRWHPNALDTSVDYSKEPTTLVEFTLEEAPGGTLLKIVESGFDQLPIERRAAALKGNDNGWNGQLKNIASYLEKEASA